MMWIAIAAIGLLTYALRASFLLLLRGHDLPRLQRTLRYVPIAVIPAITATAIAGHKHTAHLDLRLAAAAIAIAIAWRTKNIAATMLAGMLALWLLQALPL